MTARKILSIFGCFVGRSDDRWIVSKGLESYLAESIWDIVSQIVPEPPKRLSADAIQEWAKKCKAACSGRPKPEELALAAFAAYDVHAHDVVVECFVSALE